MRLSDVVETSRRVAEAGARLEKIRLLAECLAGAEPGVVEAAVGLLSGAPRQGRIGLGPATVYAAMPAATAPASGLTVAEVDAWVDRLAALRGPGSARERTRLVADLLGRATRAERDFLARALLGALGQGALEGLMVEAV
ncbi:MAG: ATP-dependent DNA ligase, partial [Rhodospirillaceae bacterium]|nr:ATP-dependent DNA ligase [Rhodospirillaceae bacterium]